MGLDLDASPVEVVLPGDGGHLDGEKVVVVVQEEVCQYFQLVLLVQSAEDLADKGVLEEELQISRFVVEREKEGPTLDA